MTLEHMLVTESILWQIAALVALLGDTVLIVVGVRMAKQSTPSIWQEAQWLRQIRRMARGEDSHVYDPEDLQVVWRQWLRQVGTAFSGAGVGILAGTLVSFALAQLTLHAPFSLPEQLLWVCFVPPIWGLTLGFACGSLIGARLTTTMRRHDAAVADTLVSQKVSNYRSPLVTAIVAMPAIVYTILTILLAPKYSPFSLFDMQIYFEIHRHALILPPHWHWILAIYPCAMWLTVLLIEVCAWVRVKSAASITSLDPELARGASMALTGLNVGFIYATAMLGPVMMGNFTAQFLSQAAHALDLDSFVDWTFTTTLIVGMTGYLVVSLFAVEGRLGGRLTGWPWSGGATQNETATAGGDGAV